MYDFTRAQWEGIQTSRITHPICGWLLPRYRQGVRVEQLFLARAYLSTFPRCCKLELGHFVLEMWTNHGKTRTDNASSVSGRGRVGMSFRQWNRAPSRWIEDAIRGPHTPLNTRDALYGGRTEAMRLHYKVKEGESIQSVDVISLYPFFCKYFKFPVGHPVLHVGDARRDMETVLQKEGLMKCCILPPGPYITMCYRYDVIVSCYFAL